jgi:hypothetical protein
MKRNILFRIDELTVNRKINYSWMSFFRISVALYCLLHLIALLPDIQIFLSENAFVAPDIVDVRANSWVPTLIDISGYFGGDSVTNLQVYTLAGVYAISLLMLALGLVTPVSALFSLLCHLVLMNSLNLYMYGVDSFCNIALFYCLIFPVGYVDSLDNAWLGKRKFSTTYANYCLLLFQIHLSIAYFIGGFDKMVGFNWRNGESIWKALHMVDAPTWLNINFLADTPFFLVMGWGVFLLEMGYFILVNIPKTRKLGLALVIGMHVSIAFFLGLFFFSTFMIILNLTIYYMPFRKEAVKEERIAEPKIALS